MKCSIVSCAGLTVTGIYFVATISYGSIEMRKNCAPAGVAQKDYDSAAKDATTATNAYNTAFANWQAANTKIIDAQCAESYIDEFRNRTAEYCHYNSLEKYNINLGIIGNTGPTRSISRVYDNIVQLEADCKFAEDYTQPFCSDNCITWTCARYCDAEDLVCYKVTATSSGDICVETRTSYVRRTCWFDRAIDRFDYYGIIASGSSNLNMPCGQYSHTIDTHADEAINSDITTNVLLQAGKVVQQRREVSHGSMLNFASKIPHANTASQPVPTESLSIQFVSAVLLQFIQQQCQSVYNNIQTAPYFAQIKSSTQMQLPRLNEELNNTKQVMQAAQETMNGKKVVLEQASELCNQSLATWLPVILLPSVAMCCMFSCYEEAQKAKNFANTNTLDTDEARCGLPILFSRPTQPTVDQTTNSQAPEFNNAVYAEPVNIQDYVTHAEDEQNIANKMALA